MFRVMEQVDRAKIPASYKILVMITSSMIR